MVHALSVTDHDLVYKGHGKLVIASDNFVFNLCNIVSVLLDLPCSRNSYLYRVKFIYVSTLYIQCLGRLRLVRELLHAFITLQLTLRLLVLPHYYASAPLVGTCRGFCRNRGFKVTGRLGCLNFRGTSVRCRLLYERCSRFCWYCFRLLCLIFGAFSCGRWRWYCLFHRCSFCACSLCGASCLGPSVVSIVMVPRRSRCISSFGFSGIVVTSEIYSFGCAVLLLCAPKSRCRGEYDGGRSFVLLCLLLLIFDCLELEGGVELVVSKLLEQLRDLLGVSVGKGLIILRKVLAHRGNAFLIQLVEALTVLPPILPIGPVHVELGGLLCPFDPPLFNSA